MVEMEDGMWVDRVKEIFIRNGFESFDALRDTADEFLFMEDIFLDKLAKENIDLFFIDIKSTSCHINLI